MQHTGTGRPPSPGDVRRWPRLWQGHRQWVSPLAVHPVQININRTWQCWEALSSLGQRINYRLLYLQRLPTTNAVPIPYYILIWEGHFATATEEPPTDAKFPTEVIQLQEHLREGRKIKYWVRGKTWLCVCWEWRTPPILDIKVSLLITESTTQTVTTVVWCSLKIFDRKYYIYTYLMGRKGLMKDATELH